MSLELASACVGSRDEETLSIGSRLCTQCGLCCTGALHHYAVLEPEEIGPARNLGLTLRTKAKPGFALPCPKLQNSACTVYESRPKVCGRYKCQLLDDVESDSTTFETASEIVRTAKQLAQSAERLMPDGLTLPEARALALGSPSDPSEQTVATQRAKLAVIALCLYLDRHFMNSSEGRLLSVLSIANSPGKMDAP